MSDQADDDSVARLIQALKAGAEGRAQEEVVKRFLHRLEALARTRLGSHTKVEDAEDVALSAMRTFLTRVPHNEFPNVNNRNSLWALLATITLNKATSARRRQLARRRDARRNVSLSDPDVFEPTHELLDSIMSAGNSLLESLPDPVCRQVAQLRMEGYSVGEIAERIGRSDATVGRKLQLVRKILQAELADRDS